MSPELARIISGNEQDRMNCERWWREASTADKLLIWNTIQHHYEDPAMEIMSRFAQLAFGEMVERDQRRKEGIGGP